MEKDEPYHKQTPPLKVLQLCHKMPYPPTDGGSLAIYMTAIGLQKSGINLQTLAINPSRQPVNIEEIPNKFRADTKFSFVNVDTRIKPIAAFINLLTKESYFISRFRSQGYEKKLTQVLSKNDFDIVQLEHLYMCLYIQVIRKHSKAKIVLRTQNVEFQVWNRYIKKIKNPLKKKFLAIAARRLQHFERTAPGLTDGVIAITREDGATYKDSTKNIPIAQVPVSFDFDQLTGYDFKAQFIDFPKLYHLGAMNWRPNEEAIEWFLKDIYPAIHENIPNLPIYLAGKYMPERFLQKANKSLHVEGFVTDALKFQEDKAILIVPLLSGSGIRAKIIEGMALGKTIISTRLGAQGIDYEAEKHLLIADSPEEFVSQLKKCIQSKELCENIGRNARELAKKEYHPLECANKMIAFYIKIL